MKKNLFLSICSLLVTTFLLIFLVFGWYVSNSNVTAGGIFGKTGGDEYELTLERATMTKEGEVTDWVQANSMAFSNVAPKNVFLFRFALKAKENKDITLNVSFDDVSSALTEGKIEVHNNKICYSDRLVPLYDIDSNNQVIVDGKVLYNVNPNTNEITLGDYLIHNTFMFYDLGTNEPINNQLAPSLPAIKLMEVANYQITANNQTTYFYFALEFNEDESLVEQDGYMSSNCYLYQNLVIGHITLRR